MSISPTRMRHIADQPAKCVRHRHNHDPDGLHPHTKTLSAGKHDPCNISVNRRRCLRVSHVFVVTRARCVKARTTL